MIGWSQPALWRNLHSLWMFILINSSKGIFLCGLRPALLWLIAKWRFNPKSQLILSHWGSCLNTLYHGFSHLAVLTFGAEHFFVIWAVMGIIRCSAASLSSTHQMPIGPTHPAPWLSKLEMSLEIVRCCQQGKIAPVENGCTCFAGGYPSFSIFNTSHFSQQGLLGKWISGALFQLDSL